MNEEASSSREGFRSNDTFQRQYATVVLQLKEVNKQVLQSVLFLLFYTFVGHSYCGMQVIPFST
jgi:succinate dehydrogenase hydrophobic anchor subunit